MKGVNSTLKANPQLKAIKLTEASESGIITVPKHYGADSV